MFSKFILGISVFLLASTSFASPFIMDDFVGTPTMAESEIKLKPGQSVVLVSNRAQVCKYYGETEIGQSNNVVITVRKKQCGDTVVGIDSVSVPLRREVKAGGAVLLPVDGIVQKQIELLKKNNMIAI